MKFVILILAVCITNITWAKTAVLQCSSPNPYQSFGANLDYSAFDKNSGYFDVKEATIQDNYATANLICSGYTVKEIGCVGFWFDTSEHIVEVQIVNHKGNLSAIYRALKGVQLKGGPWPCVIK